MIQCARVGGLLLIGSGVLAILVLLNATFTLKHFHSLIQGIGLMACQPLLWLKSALDLALLDAVHTGREDTPLQPRSRLSRCQARTGNTLRTHSGETYGQ